MKNSLYEKLDIQDGSEFEYFEDLENILESDEEIAEDQLYSLLKEVDMNVLGELFENYFDELTDNIPDGQMDLFQLLTNIGTSLRGMAFNCEDDGTRLMLAQEIIKFRKWFIEDKTVEIIEDDTHNEKIVTPYDALITYRMEKLGGKKYEYYFDKALEYKLEDYVLSFKDLLSVEK